MALEVEGHLVPAADEVPLATTVFRSPERERSPVVLLRSPYDQRLNRAEGKSWASRGFACVTADTRGRFGSGGTFLPYVHERSDGATLLDWVHAQDFCDGRVLLAGASYGAYCALVTAAARTAPVAGVIAAVPAMGPGETAREPGGAARLACRAGWWSEHGGTAQPRPPVDLDLAHLPVRDLVDQPGWPELWSAPRRGPLWSELRHCDVPLLAIGGVHDPFAADTAELAATWGGPARLVLGPWGHLLDSQAPGAALAGKRIGSLYLAFAHAALNGLTGDGAWIATGDHWSHWPTSTGPTHRLSVARGVFTADPANPFPSRAPAADLSIDAHRPDRALLHSAPLPGGVLRGRIGVRLRLRADTPDNDWLLRLSTVDDNRQLAHTIFRDTAPPGHPVERTAELGPLGVELPAGTRLRLEIAGHHWPRHARNPHTGVDPVDAIELRLSRREVLAVEFTLPWAAATDAVAAANLIEEVVR
ncbi:MULTISPECIES: CocE/NonD family hydrolase [unclassified Crossiella]|uniref:CocE/NonD family hydrolase n=1 Tax=unclassified Crossiella TaxID=2620835 RepID=UPI001FFEE1F1|nr:MULTISPECIES: CocE/NonD family hydrolase [unclassified Crossiella]MCK2237553.1 CocE/NonD family hydrolase [Crossiella sp. S99.2]MCK2254839.1 CocE/NonD family hydrolase [Crossiella sp. S99.1]